MRLETVASFRENDMGIRQDVLWFNRLMASRGARLSIGLAPCGDIDLERRKNKARFAHVGHKPSLICCAKSFPGQSQSRRRGIIAHEIGHQSLMNKGNWAHREHEADAEAERVLGVKIRYDKKGLQRL